MTMFLSGITSRGSFKRQIILAFVVGFFLLVTAYSVYQIDGEREHLYRDSSEATTGLAESLAVSSLAGVLANDVMGLQEVVRSFQTYPELRYAMVISPAGRVLAHSDATKVGQFVSDPQSLALIKAPAQTQTMLDNDGMADVAVPISINNRQVGWARIGLGRGKISSELRELMLSSAVFVLLATALSLLAATLIANRLGRRIGSLVRVAEQVHAGNLATRASIPGAEDEITKLADNLNQMLDALARNEERLRLASLYTRSLIEASLDPLVTISPEGSITDVNEGSVKAVGVPREELIGTDFSNYFTEPDKARAVYRQVFAKGFVTDYPLTIRHRDGRLTDVLYNASLYRDLGGSVLGVFAAARDVTERNKAEQEVAQLGLRNRLILDSAGEGIYGLDIDGCCTFVNPAALQLLGFKLEELMGQHSHALFHHTKPDQSPFLEEECPVQAAYKQGAVHRGSDLYWRKDGSCFPVEFISTPMREAGKITGAVVAFRDITERQLAEEQLRRSEHGLADAQRIAHLGNWELDLSSNVLTWSDEIYRIFELDPEKFDASYDAFLNAIHPQDREMVNKAYTESVKDKVPYEIVHRLQMADGRIKYVNEKCETYYGEGGKPLRSVGTVHDITERKLDEQMSQRLNRELRAISNCNQALMRAENEQTLLNEICQIICEQADYRMAWVGYAENDEAKTVRPAAWAGFEDGYLAQAAITWADAERGRGPAGATIRGGMSTCLQDFGTDPRATPWHDSALQRGYRSCLSLPLKDESQNTFGVLTIYSTEPNAFTPDEVRLLEELGGDLAFGVTVLRTRIKRKRVEENLWQMNERYSLSTRAARLGVWDWDLLKNELVWDDRMYELYGVKREDFAGAYEAWLKGIHPDDRAASDEVSKQARRGEREYDTEFRVLWPDGSIHHLKAYGQFVRDADGKPIRMTGVNYDITALKRAEEKLQERERHSQSLLHLSRNLERSQTYAEILQAAQVEVKKIVGYQNLWVYLLSEDKAYLKALVASGPESGVLISEEGTATLTIAGDRMLEEIALAKDIVVVEDAQTDERVNKEIVARIGSRTIVNVPIILSGRHLGTVGVGTFGAEGVRIPSSSEQKYLIALASHMAAALDRIQLLAERKKASEELLRYKDHLEEQVQQRTADLVLARNAAEAANRAKSVFLSSMSHELRTPLNAILGFSNMMRKDPLLQMEQHENLDIISRSGEHLLTLINDVLEMAKIEAGRVQLESAPFDLGGLVRDVTDMMHVRAQEKGLQLLIDQASEFPRYIKGDEARVRQVLINLLGNAVKFTQQGGVTVRFGLKPHATPQRLLIEVEDSGLGIKPEDQQKIFEPFVQLGKAAAQKGTGLGLTITRQFVQLMGGDISVQSIPGKGSTFRVELPLQRVEVGEVTIPQGVSRGEIVGLAPEQPQYRILIVEDQLENQLLLSKLMKNLGLQTQLAENGEQAVSLFQSWAPHLIWMDRRMPVMDGLEAARRIRELPGGKEVKIVAVTASAFTEQRDEMLKAGMDDFVRKPYRFNEIYECLGQQLGLRFRYAEAPAVVPAGDLVLTAQMLALLPADLRRELHDALESLEGERIDTVIQQVAAVDPGLHKTLLQLAENFDYPTILKALQTNDPVGET